MTDCIFCRIVAGEIPSTRVHEDEETLVFRDIHPAAPSHLLVIPKRHVATLESASKEDLDLLGRLLESARRAARVEGIAESGYRLVMNNGPDAGQDVLHVHLHILGGKRLSWPPG